MILDTARLLLFPALMAFAAASDLFTMTISNRVSLALIAGFVALAVLGGGAVSFNTLPNPCSAALADSSGVVPAISRHTAFAAVCRAASYAGRKVSSRS